MQYFVGLDVALRSLALCIIDGDGEIVLEKALLCEVEDITPMPRNIQRRCFQPNPNGSTIIQMGDFRRDAARILPPSTFIIEILI